MNVPETDQPTAPLHALAREIKRRALVSYIEVIEAKVPIVKLDHIRSGYSVDICCNNSSGAETGELVRRFAREYPPLRPLTLVLKIFLVIA